MKVTRLVVLALLWLGCPLDPTVEYRCSEAQPQCPAGAVCRDGLCQLNAVAGGASGGGAVAGGSAGGEVGGGSAGGPVVDGGTDAGCVPSSCGVTDCGYRSDGCGDTLICGVCDQGTECGVLVPNRCAPVPSLCTTEGHCWENPRLHGNGVLDLYSPRERIIWLPTANGTLLFFDGERTSVEPIPTRTGIDFNAIHGCGRNDIYLVGDRGLVLHYDGATWTDEALPTSARPDLTFVHCIGNGSDVVAGGANNALFVRENGRWQAKNSSLQANRHHAASIGTDVWLLNQNGRLLQPGRASWEPVDASVPLADVRDFKAVNGRLYALGQLNSGPADAGLNRFVERLDDGGWSVLFEVTQTQPGDVLNAFDSLDGDEFWFAGGFNGVWRATRDGGLEARRLDPMQEVRTFNAVKAQGPGRAFFAGSEGAYAFARGSSTTTTALTQRISGVGKLCVGPSGPAPLLAAPLNNNSNLTRTDTSGVAEWPVLDSPDETRATNWRACAFRSPDQLAIVGTDAGFALSSRAGPRFFRASFVSIPDAGGLDFIRVWGTPGAWHLLTGPSSAGQYVVTWDGGSTVFTRLDAGIRDLATVGSETVLVGDQGGFIRFGNLSAVQLGKDVRSIHGTFRQGAPFFVLAGRDGVWWERPLGNFPIEQPPFTDAGFTGVWVSSTGSTWFVGTPPGGGPGAMLYIRAADGGLTLEPIPFDSPPTSIMGREDDAGLVTVWMGGARGGILRRDPRRDGGL